MREELQKIKKEVTAALKKIKAHHELDALEVAILGRKGKLATLMKRLKDMTVAERKTAGALLNALKNEVEEMLRAERHALHGAHFEKLRETEWVDLGEPVLPVTPHGHLHPVTQIGYELEEIFRALGFMVIEGPELESDFYNFEALNIPSWHPARESMDTFYIKDHTNWVMRTHTSPMQVRAMQKYGAPIRAIVPGRVFRNEATDASHEHTFYQVEGLMVDKNISIANLIAVMKELLRGIFKYEVPIRLRPGHFPFVEPGFELDIQCSICRGKGCSVCKERGWLELLPCGMVHPRVLEYGGVDPAVYSGFAFGLGWDRLVMMRYGIEDIRHIHSGDMRFLNQF